MDTLVKKNLQNADRDAERFSKLPKNKKAAVIAFMNGMETQKAIEEDGRGAKETV